MPPVEKWKTIKDYEGYEVSNRGRIRNKNTGHILSNTRTGNGYLKVNLGTGPKCTKRVNRLVAFAFLGDPPAGKVYCHHINHDPADNRVENLEWVTPEENSLAHVEWHGKYVCHWVHKGRFSKRGRHSQAVKQPNQTVRGCLEGTLRPPVAGHGERPPAERSC